MNPDEMNSMPSAPAPEETVTPDELQASTLSPDPTMSQSGPQLEVTENDRLMAAAAYATQVFLPIAVPAIMLLSEENKQRPFQRFHAIQSLGFLVAAVIYEVLATIVFVGLTIVSLGCLSCVLWILFLLPVVPAFYYAYQAYQGEYFRIPLVTDFLVQNKWLEAPPA
jgi:uncharacterized membrane protein